MGKFNTSLVRNSSFAILLFLVLFGAGFFGGVENAYAASPKDKGKCDGGPIDTRENCEKLGLQLTEVTDPWGTCTFTGDENQGAAEQKINMYSSDCENISGGSFSDTPQATDNLVTTPQVADPSQSEFAKVLSTYSCNILSSAFRDNPAGCIVKIFYNTGFAVAAGVLWLSAKFFDYMIFATLSGELFKGNFVTQAWGIVRDLSNLFFILILLYIAFQVILNLAHHEVKKMISRVVIVALLINFSMFFTGIVIDSSNILALVFYNKMKVTYTDAQGQEVPRPDTAVGAEKGISGNLASKFNLTNMISKETIEAASLPPPGVSDAEKGQPSVSLILLILIIGAVVMYFAAYVFFVAGFSFLGRLVELWVLIIASPFAFMSSTIHQLEGIKDWGWKNWLHRLLTASFMASAFMFFLYFITLLMEVGANDLLTPKDNTTLIGLLLSFVLPTLLILILLLKSVKLAKASAGQLGETVAKWGGQLAGVAGGLALGAATGGASMLATGTLGKVAGKVAGSESLKGATEEKGMKGWAARKFLKTADYGSKASFDLKQAPGFGKLAGKAGISSKAMEMASPKTEGGFKGRVERKSKELEKEMGLYKTSMTDSEVTDWSKKKQYEYDAKRREAREREESAGKPFDAAKFEKENGPRPELITKAETLNHARENAFKENLGQSGLLQALAHSTLRIEGGLITDEAKLKDSSEYKKWDKRKEAEKEDAKKKQGMHFVEDDFEKAYRLEHKEPTIESVNKDRVKKTGMLFGASAAIMTGGLGGAAFGAAGAGMLAGGVGAGAYKTGTAWVEESGEGKFAKGVEKHQADMHKIDEQMENVRKGMENLTKSLEKASKIEIPGADGSVIKGIVSGNAENPIVDHDKLERAITQLEYTARRSDIRLQELVRQGKNDNDPEMKTLAAEAVKNNSELSQLKSMRGVEEQSRKYKRDRYNLGRHKTQAEEHDKKGHEDEGKPHKAEVRESKPRPTPPPASSPPSAAGGDHPTH